MCHFQYCIFFCISTPNVGKNNSKICPITFNEITYHLIVRTLIIYFKNISRNILIFISFT